MGQVAGIENRGVSGRYVYKNWVLGQDGRRLGAVPAGIRETPPDLIASYYRNANGSQSVFAIPIDLDASRAQSQFSRNSCWL